MQQEYQSALSLLSDEGFMNTGTMTETACKLEWVREGGMGRGRGGDGRESGLLDLCIMHRLNILLKRIKTLPFKLM